jgi:hypothetical protein
MNITTDLKMITRFAFRFHRAHLPFNKPHFVSYRGNRDLLEELTRGRELFNRQQYESAAPLLKIALEKLVSLHQTDQHAEIAEIKYKLGLIKMEDFLRVPNADPSELSQILTQADTYLEQAWNTSTTLNPHSIETVEYGCFYSMIPMFQGRFYYSLSILKEVKTKLDHPALQDPENYRQDFLLLCTKLSEKVTSQISTE